MMKSFISAGYSTLQNGRVTHWISPNKLSLSIFFVAAGGQTRFKTKIKSISFLLITLKKIELKQKIVNSVPQKQFSMYISNNECFNITNEESILQDVKTKQRKNKIYIKKNIHQLMKYV